MTSQKRPSRRRVLAGAAAATSVFAAPAIVRAQGKGPLKVGMLLPRSGFEAAIGQDCQRGVDIAPPILKSLGLPDLTIMNGDTESNVDVARERAEKLIGEGAQLLVGAFDSGQTTAIAQVAEQKGIPLVINIAGAPPITEQGYKFVFRNFPTAVTITADAFTNHKEVFALAGVSPKTAVFMRVNDTFGTAMSKGVAALMPKFDMPYKIADEISYDPAARDLSVEVSKAKATNAEVLLIVGRLNDAMLITKELIKQRWTPQGAGRVRGPVSQAPEENGGWTDQLRALVRPKQKARQDAGSRLHQEISGQQPQHQRRLHLRGVARRRRGA